MTLQISTKKKQIALIQHEQNLQEIYDLYWTKDIYQIPYGNMMVENFRYRYPVKFIFEKFNISQSELIYLISLKGEKKGICIYCKQEIYKYDLRSKTNQLTCNCKANCKKCGIPGDFYNIQQGLCSNCTPQEFYQFSPPIKEYSFENKYEGCAVGWDASDILEEIETNELDQIITILSVRLKFIKKVRKIMDE